jgi:linoleoyl-CoA desaturase
MKAIRFDTKSHVDFYKTLRKRVDSYFTENGLSKKGNTWMVFKTVAMSIIYLTPLVLMYTGIITNFWVMLGLYLIMGIGSAGVGFTIMHDACHGAYSSNQKVNDALSVITYLIGGCTTNWKIQHNVLHHTFTNIDSHDEDIAPVGKLLRFSPNGERHSIHRFQHIYAWLLYTLMTLSWITNKDFSQLKRYQDMDLLKGQRKKYSREMLKLAAFKLFYYVYLFVVPAIIMEIPWYLVLVGFVSMHLLSGFILSIVFQPAHVMEHNDFPMAEEGSVENHFAVHQLLTTTNFAPKSRVFSWYVGGLNFQVEHHLFPQICHIHYKKIAPIVERTAKEFGIPYHSEPTFARAIYVHAKMLKQLGVPA